MWNSFETAVHNNNNLSDIEKFHYLKSNVSGEARSAILKLALYNDNHVVAVGILKERFGKLQEVIDLHYTKMINLHSAMNTQAV